ncbi:heme-binding protein [Rhodococcus sp. NPDC058505]|uniref:heme-binding protein n=1 Tax=unclassified Rhodococcus (in: high G+C Gram-positive bacteria) TaxID=192944 RepID=UPI00365EC025
MNNVLNLVRARAAVDAAFAAAAQQDKRVSVVVVDDRGHDVLAARSDGAPWFTAGVARAKAATAAAMGAASGDLAGLKVAHPELLELIGAQAAHPMTTLPGGVPIRLAGTVVGAIGVSGAEPDEDAAYARAGYAAVKALGQSMS